jgi:exodeoxyribonuclease-3
VQLVEVLAAQGFREWSVVHAPCRAQLGRNGVAVLSAQPITATTVGLPQFEDDGRWIEATVDKGDRPLIVVSAYVPKGHAGEPVQDHKMEFLAAATRRMRQLKESCGCPRDRGPQHRAHRSWPPELEAADRKSGFLSENAPSWTPGSRRGGSIWGEHCLAGPGRTWWSQRGRAFDNDAGWRIVMYGPLPPGPTSDPEPGSLRADSWDTR